MDDILWSISWSAALTPELQMIPDRSVFLCATHVSAHAHASLLEGMVGSLLPLLPPDSVGADLSQPTANLLARPVDIVAPGRANQLAVGCDKSAPTLV